MADPIDWFANLATEPEDAVRWACILEATAPKAGNVYPGRSFSDLRYPDFVEGAEIAASCFAHGVSSDSDQDQSRRISACMLRAVKDTAARRGTNVNLGIVLLLGPLVAADRLMVERRKLDQRGSSQSSHGSSICSDAWKASIRSVLDSFDAEDGANLYQGDFRCVGRGARSGG